MFMTYQTDEETRKNIDILQHKMAVIESNLGTDSTPTEVWQAKKEQSQLRLIIKKIDVEYYKLISSEDEIIKESKL